MVTRRTTADSRRAAARVVVLWPVLVTIGFPAFALSFGRYAGYLFALALIASTSVVFARFGFLGLATVTCDRCGGQATVGQLYCPHCGMLHERVHAPLLQVLAAGLILPLWFLIAESFLVTLVGALWPIIPVIQPFVEFYRAFAFGSGFSIAHLLVATGVVPLCVTTVARVVIRSSDTLAARRTGTQ